MKPVKLGALLVLVSIVGAGCHESYTDSPPVVRLGDSICDQCGMILSDERFATSTIVKGLRGPEAKLFDDFNCQANYEVAQKSNVVTRWSHDYVHSAWIETKKSTFLVSEKLLTPMSSKAAAFATIDEAKAAQETLGGEVLTFEAAWKRLKGGQCCPSEADSVRDPVVGTPGS